MHKHGFLRVAAAVPQLRVGDWAYNAERIAGLLQRAEAEGVALVVFPELCLTGYTCADLFQHPTLQRGALAGLEHVVRRGGQQYHGVAIVGLPLAVDDQLFNTAAVVCQGRMLGMVPKSFLPNYKEFYEHRWFAPAAAARSREVCVLGRSVPFGTDLLFRCDNIGGWTLGVEICEDLWVPVPPSSLQALAGATVLANLSASNEYIGKVTYRRQLVTQQSGRCIAGYVYASCGVWESTTDLVFGGHCLVAENGTLLAESARFARQETLLVADLDLEHLAVDRQRTNSFGAAAFYPGQRRDYRLVSFALDGVAPAPPLRRSIDPHPFVPRGEAQLHERCAEIFHIQVAGLAKRLEYVGKPPVAIGVSGGLDSTLALLVSCKTMDTLGMSREQIHAFTLPGFGTTRRTLDNARALMRHLGVQAREVDIRPLCLEQMRALGHAPFGIDLDGHDVDSLTARLRQLPAEQRHDLVFENIQARMRTNILMNAGFVIGTGDVSELALGWCTYNADHMSMYNPNVSIPKTLVQFLVDWVARHEFDGPAQQTLLDIVATEISPELLPPGADGQTSQATEAAIGPYELHDFFLFHFLRYGSSPERILFLAEQARFDRGYSPAELRRWLRVFIRRFFASQYKRSCLPDGPKVGSISLSPRGDWRMPSDAEAARWLAWAEAGAD
ncbi:MAG: NAD(+) synthase [Gemmataceae bacterium]|nr:NAD(+) synthase [Gemmataceae bacterium]MDW8267316.1 NAD(+) synthase [Gemmataceae bacterium]